LDWMFEKRIAALESLNLVEREGDALSLGKPLGLWAGWLGVYTKAVLKIGREADMILLPIMLAVAALRLSGGPRVDADPARPRKNVFVMALLAAVAYCLMVVVASRIRFKVPARPVSGPAFAFLTVCYFHFYFGVDRSVR